MGPTFHVLRDIRAGKLHTRQTRRESAWSLANHQGYLSACEMHSSESLERSTQNQLTFLKKFAAAWESRDKMTLFRLMSECEAFFDPNRPSTLVHFTGLGGIDLFVRLLCDNAEWLTSPSYGLLLFHPDEGINVYNTMLRVLTELLVCHNDIGWYLYDRHRGLIFRLMELMKVERLRDSAIMLLEHIISVVGPIVHIPSHPDLIETIRGLSDGGLAAMCRVLALLVVPGVMTDQLWKSKRMEPFPQCLVRIEKIQTIVDDNVNWIIQESGLVLRLLDLGKVRSSGVRIFQGNRTMTVIAPEPGVAAAVAGAAGSLPIPTMGAAAAALSTGAQTILSHLMGSANSAAMPGNATPFTPQSGTSMGNSTQAFGATEDFEGDDDDYEDVDEDDMFNGGSNLVLSEEMLNNPAALQQALQHILASVAQQPQQAAAPPAAPTVPVPSSTTGASPGGAAPASAGPPQAAGPAPPIPAPTEQQTLQTIAESLSHDMPPINGLDSINFSWFCGRPDTKGRWRFQSMRVDPAEYERTFGLLTPPEAHQRAGAKFFETLQKDEVNRKAKASPKQQRAMAVAEQQAIVNSQSEIFFVLNSIMVTCHYTKAWHVLASYNTLQRCLDVFDSVFFVNQQSTSIHASPPSSRNSTSNTANNFATDSVHTVDRFESSHAVAHRAGKFYETFWNPCPTTCIVTPAAAAGKQKVVPLGVGTNVHHNADVDDDDFATNLRDDPAATTREGDLSDDESEDSMDHRHDPDTLRKLELLRIIHEYCNAQDRGEWSRLTQTLLPTTSVNGVSRASSTPLMHDLAKKVASQLITGVEDACTETVGAHALESILRCLGFRSTSRRRLSSGASEGEHESAATPMSSNNNTHEAVANILLPHLIGERIFNGITGSSGTAHALSPWKRVDAFFAVMGETCKYNSASIRLLVRYLKGDIAVPSTPTYLGTPVTQPDATGAASALQSAPIARGQHDTVLSVFRYRLRRFGVDTNLFIRCMCLSITPELASPINYVWKPLNDSEASTSPANVVTIMDELKDSRSYLPDERVLEPTKNQMQRIYYVRELSRKLIEEFTQRFMESSEKSEEETESGDIRKMQWSRDALAAIFKAPSFYDATPAGRPFPNLFSEEELCILHPCSALPRAGLSSELRNALVGTFGDTSAAPSGATAEADKRDLDFIAESLFQAPQELAYSMLSMLNAETIENTERLCVVTSTMLLFLRASRLGGQAAVDALLDSVADIARARREKYVSRRKRLQRSGGSVAALAPCQAHGGAGQCNIETPLEHQCDNFVFFGHCVPNTVVRDYYDLHGSDFFKNFFRLLCVWLAHYSCSQRYVETLYYCTEVPFGEWKMLALYLFRAIPNYFFAAV